MYSEGVIPTSACVESGISALMCPEGRTPHLSGSQCLGPAQDLLFLFFSSFSFWNGNVLCLSHYYIVEAQGMFDFIGSQLVLTMLDLYETLNLDF